MPPSSQRLGTSPLPSLDRNSSNPLLSQAWDELNFEVPEKDLGEGKWLVKHEMEGVGK